MTSTPISPLRISVNDDRYKMMFGFALLTVLAALAAIIALGKVEMSTSYGLNIVLGALCTLSGGFAQWAFNRKDKGE